MRKTTIFVLLLVVVAASAVSADVRANIKEVNDNRSTGDGFFTGLTIELSVVGDELRNAKALRFLVATAKDETGENLIDETEDEPKFGEPFGSDLRAGRAKIEVELRNPARKAMVVSELSGVLEVFAPDKDPKSLVEIPGFRSKTGTPFASEILQEAGVKITVLTKKQIEEVNAKKSEPPKPDEAEEADLAEAFAELFKGLLGGMSLPTDDKSIVYKIDDPNSKLIYIKYLGPDGKEFGWNENWATEDGFLVHGFDEPFPKKAVLRVYLKTEKAVVSTPLSIKNIALP